MSNTNVWWIGPVVLILLRLAYAEAKTSQASKSGSTLIFRVGALTRQSFIGGIILFASLTIWGIIKHESPFLIAGFGLFFLFGCFSWPSTIVIDRDGVSRKVWWKRTVFIPWDEVTELERTAGDDWTLYGSGAQIEFDRFHEASSCFESEVLRRANLAGSKQRTQLTSLEI